MLAVTEGEREACDRAALRLLGSPFILLRIIWVAAVNCWRYSGREDWKEADGAGECPGPGLGAGTGFGASSDGVFSAPSSWGSSLSVTSAMSTAIDPVE
jgi:hypothetical protein